MASPFPIEVIPLSSASCGSLLWRVEGTLRATIIVKATFALTHEGDGYPIEPAVIARRDRYRSSLAPSSLEEARDTMPYLPGAGVVLSGHATAPKGNPTSAMAVRLIVAREEVLVDKTLHVFGDRTPQDPENPAPFERIPLVYERAHGGLFTPENPLGTGAENDGTPPPNIVYPDDPGRPAGFGPLPSHHPERRQWLGPAERERVDRAVPELPDDFDGRYFHAAPKDQQTGFLRGDEWILLEGMHPDHPRLQTRLPYPQAHAQWHLVSEQSVGPPRALGLFADSLIIDADRLVASVVWRGHFPLDDERDVLRARVFAGIAYPDKPIHWPAPGQVAEVSRKLRAEGAPHKTPITMPPPQTAQPRRRERSQTLTDDQTDDSPAVDRTPFQIAPPSRAEPAAAAATIAIPGAPWSKRPAEASAPASEEASPAPAAEGSQQESPSPAIMAPVGGWPMAPERLAPPLEAKPAEPEGPAVIEPPAHLGALVPAEPPKPPGLREKVMDLLLEGASFDGMDLAGADLSKLDFTGRSLAKCHLKGSLLTGAIFASANLSGARLPDADLTDADLRGADLTRANLTRATLVRARFDGATIAETNLTSAEGAEASFRGATGSRPTFARSRWEKAVFAEIEAQNADFSGASLGDADFRRATLLDVRLDGATGAGASFNDARLPKAHAQGATLTSCSLLRVDAPGSVWEQATLTGSTFQGANLQGASFVKAACSKVDFSEATLSEARLRQADLSHADLSKAILDGAKMQRAKGDGANLKGARLDGADLRQATMPGAIFADVRMHKGWADNADLTGARFSGADLKKTSLRAATLVGASFAYADLEGVDLRDADLTGANMVGASKQGAKMQGADLTGVKEIETDPAELPRESEE